MTESGAMPGSLVARALHFMLAAALMVAAAIPWALPAILLPVYWNQGTAFELGPIAEGWSIAQEIEMESTSHFGFSFFARSAKRDGRLPTLEVRLERGDQILWADRVRIESADMKKYEVEFPISAAAGRYTVRLRVLETEDGAAIFRGVNPSGDVSVPYALSVMALDQPDDRALDFQVLQLSAPWSWLRYRPLMSPAGWLIAFSAGTLIVVPVLAGWSLGLRRRYSGAAVRVLSLSAASALALYLTALPIVEIAGFNLANGSGRRSIASIVVFPLVLMASYVLAASGSASRSNGSAKLWRSVLAVVFQIPPNWTRGWRLIARLLLGRSLRLWRGTPLALAVTSGVLLAAGDTRLADYLAMSAVISLIPAALWPRGRRNTDSA